MDKSDKDRNRKKCSIMGSISDPEQFDSVISGLQNCNFYAWIYHDSDRYSDKDYEEGNCRLLQIGTLKPKHLHFLATDKNSRTWNSWGDMLGIPSNMVQYMRDIRGMTRYLIHKDSPEKFQYSLEDIHTNNLDKLQSYLTDEDSSTVLTQYQDFINLRLGKITPTDFINLHRGRISSLGFYQRLRLFGDILDNYDLSRRKEIDK